MAELMIAELTDGVGKTRHQGGHHQGRDQRGRDHRLREDGARAPRPRPRSRRARRSRRTPTAARWAPTSSSILIEQGVPPHRIIIGHCVRHERPRLPHEDRARRLVPGLRPLRARHHPPRQRARVVAAEADQEGSGLADRRLARHRLVLARRADRTRSCSTRSRSSGRRRTSPSGSCRSSSRAARRRRTSTSSWSRTRAGSSRGTSCRRSPRRRHADCSVSGSCRGSRPPSTRIGSTRS